MRRLGGGVIGSWDGLVFTYLTVALYDSMGRMAWHAVETREECDELSSHLLYSVVLPCYRWLGRLASHSVFMSGSLV
jgi:hypothetical protein